ncbi:MAG TPA: hypothetical protein VF945_07135, partial [Polyangia bacterium]
TVTGTPVALSASPPYNLGLNGCTSGSKTCSIDFDLPLSAPFDAGAAIDGSVGVVLIASDVVGNQATSSASSVKLTRFWWRRTLGTSGAAVTGLAVHPNGALLATTATTANNDGVFALYADGPLNGGASSNCAAGAVPGVSWCVGHDFYAAGSGLGAINGVAVGDDANGKLAYVTTNAGDVVALTGAGAKQWSCGKLFGSGLSAPAVATSKVATQASCEAVLFGNGNKVLAATCNPSGTACVQATGSSADLLTTPIATANATYYVGTNNRVGQATIDGTSGQFTALNYFGSGLGSIDGLAFDGAELYASSNQGAALYQLSTNLVAGFTAAFAAKPPEGSPVVRGTSVLSSDSSGALRTMSITATGSIAPATLIGLTQPGFTPLLGSDGRTYVGSTNGVVTAVQESPPTISWTFSGATTSSFSVAPTMDCRGHLYAAAADTVFAFLTDARGLRATAWPKYQRDTRNSGNADRTASSGAPYGVYNGTACIQ